MRTSPDARLLEARDQAQGRGLAAARRPEKGEERAAPDPQDHVVDRHHVAEPLADPGELDVCLGQAASILPAAQWLRLSVRRAGCQARTIPRNRLTGHRALFDCRHVAVGSPAPRLRRPALSQRRTSPLAACRRGLRPQLRRPPPAPDPARGTGRRRALPVLLRCALHPGLPDLDRHPAVHPADRHRQSARLGEDDPRRQHHGRHVRPGLPDRDPVRGGLRARDGRGQAGRDRPAAALRHRRTAGDRPPALPPGTRHWPQAWPWSAPVPPALPAPTSSRPWAMPSRLRGPGQGGRPERVRHRRLQDGE